MLSKEVDAKENPDSEEDLLGAMDGDEPVLGEAMQAERKENWEAGILRSECTVLTVAL